MSRRLLVPRRRLLKGLTASAALPGLVGCKPERDPAAPGGHEPGAIDTIVICMMENRSFDHVFGSYSLLEGRTEVDGLLPHQPPERLGVLATDLGVDVGVVGHGVAARSRQHPLDARTARDLPDERMLSPS